MMASAAESAISDLFDAGRLSRNSNRATWLEIHGNPRCAPDSSVLAELRAFLSAL
jgi:hypothetical protein